MKKIFVILLSVLLLIGFTGCGFSVNNDFNIEDYDDTINNSDRIDVIVDNKRVDMISGHNNMEDFINAIKLDEWKIKELPDDAKKNAEFVMYKNKTKKAGSKDNSTKFIQVAKIITYKDINYVTLSIAKMEFDFKIPDDVSDYLNTFI
ncbi:hypothetical protein [Anaerofustis stercorihominis]|uniref:hypothetical protein n=1 Tax=Anaerofustis stercorihominis TaxID=214853 RepID=UPI00214BA0F2|nr:hypothetical protein [Anaerofustis stercorihominis]MCR2031995.1 hypothetical protein [Anaerofustis stercorihominis]